MSKRVTLEQIAEACGVTKGLVSRALGGKYNVGDEMRSIINQKAVELGYNFDKLRSKSHESAKVTLMISSRILLKEDFWQPIIKAMSATLDHNSIKLDYCIYDEKNIVDIEEKVKSSSSKAYILMHSNPEELVNLLIKTKKPVIEIDPKVLHFNGVTEVKFSNYASIYEATQMLIDKGHKTIAFYGSDMHATSFRERHEGFLACMDMNKDKAKCISIIFDNSTLQYSDNDMLRNALEENKIDALICANDIIALNAYKVIKSMGLTIPQDVSVIGFDNIRESESSYPRLSTFNVPRDELGNEVAKYLINLFADRQLPFSQIVISCEYIEKDSIREI